MLIGEEALLKLKNSHVAVFGVGGVGGFAAEAIARCGVGKITLVDNDTVAPSNINRQIVALSSSIGKQKSEVMKSRILDINPEAEVITQNIFFGPDNSIDLSKFDYIIDAIDSVGSKLFLIESASAAGVPIICAMGAGNKLDPTKFEVCDISKTSVCPLAKTIRTELSRKNIKNVKCVYSKESPVKTGERTPGSISFVPSAMGLILAGEAIKDIIKRT